jgi:hypothetical protein
VRAITANQQIMWATPEVAPVSWTPDLLNFRSPQWQESTHPMRRNSAGR